MTDAFHGVVQVLLPLMEFDGFARHIGLSMRSPRSIAMVLSAGPDRASSITHPALADAEFHRVDLTTLASVR
jgi:hypothetical protein